MTIRLTLVCGHTMNGTADTVFGHGALREDDLREAGAGRAVTPSRSPAVRSPSTCCALTASALGLDAAVDPALRDIDYGTWCGRTMAEVVTADPHGFSAWITDPDAAPHGGESIRQLCHRAAHWLNSLTRRTGSAVVVAEPAVARALLVHALSAPVRAFWSTEVPPLYVVSLMWGGDAWSVRPADDTFPTATVRYPSARHADHARRPAVHRVPHRPHTSRVTDLSGQHN